MSKINVSGTWRDIAQPYVNVSGTWRTVSEIHANVAGTWKKVWPLVSTAASLTTITVSAFNFSPSSATVYYMLSTDGKVYGGASTSSYLEDWRDLGSNPDFEHRFTLVSGTAPAGVSYNTWLSASTTRTMSMTQSGLGGKTSVVDVDIRDVATGTILTTARITMMVTVESGM